MSSDATTLRLRDTLPGGSLLTDGRTQDRTDATLRHARICGGALIAIGVCSLLFVVIAADRPSLFAAPTRPGFFPGWMAGPLGGLWPGLTRDGTALRYMFTAGLVVMYVCYLLALAYVPSLRASARWVIATVLLAHVLFFLAPPLALTDVFNYVNYGRMEIVHHLNPYTSFPILEPHSDPSYFLSNWHELLSPYGPLFTLLTFALVPLGVPLSFWVIKAVLMLTSLSMLALVWRCAQMLDLDPVRAVVLVGLNPIVLVWGLGGDHNDFLTVFAIVLAFYLLLRARDRVGAGCGPLAGAEGLREEGLRMGGEGPCADAEQLRADAGSRADEERRARAWRSAESAGFGILRSDGLIAGAGAALVVATALKASAGLLIPIVLAYLIHQPRRSLALVAGMVVAGAAVGAASLIAFGFHLPDLATQSRLVTDISIPNLIGLAVGAGGETATLHTLLTAALILTVIGCCVAAWRARTITAAITAAGWSTVALLVTLGWVLPWYVLWLLPLAALSRSRRLRTTALVLGAYLIIAWAPASGLLWSGIGFYPQKTPLGRLHQRYVKELLN